MSEASVLRLSPDVTIAELQGESVVLHLKDGNYFSANGTATLLLQRLATSTGATRASLVEAIATDYRIPAERAAADVDRWLAEMRRHGILAEEPA